MKKEEINQKIEVGDRVTFIYENKKVTEIVGSSETMKEILKIIEVLKTEKIGANGWYTVYEKQSDILDEKEKEYLSAVIKPFKNKVTSISKKEDYTKKEYIRITLFKKQYKEDINLPDFKTGKMYKNMEIDKKYTLKELGLE